MFTVLGPLAAFLSLFAKGSDTLLLHQSRLHSLHKATLFTWRAQLLQLIFQIYLVQDVVDSNNMCANATILETFSCGAAQIGRVPLTFVDLVCVRIAQEVHALSL